MCEHCQINIHRPKNCHCKVNYNADVIKKALLILKFNAQRKSEAVKECQNVCWHAKTVRWLKNLGGEFFLKGKNVNF